jgi:hypothetical protein
MSLTIELARFRIHDGAEEQLVAERSVDATFQR